MTRRKINYPKYRKINRNISVAVKRPDLLKIWDYEKNIRSPYDIGLGSGTKVWWKCTIGNSCSFDRRPRDIAISYSDLSKANSCLICKDSIANKRPDLLKIWDYDKNSITPYEITPGADSRKVWWKCGYGKECSYDAYPNHVTRNFRDKSKTNWCMVCNSQRASIQKNLAKIFPHLKEEWDHEKNYPHKPDDFLPGSNFMAHWKCNRGHSWKANISNRAHKTNPTGCPYCGKSKSSKPEMRVLAELESIFENVKSRYKLKNKELDIYLPEIKIGIEFDGSYWHRNKIDNDLKKNKFFLSHGIKVIRIRPNGLKKVQDHDVQIKIYNEVLRKEDLNNLASSIQLYSPENYSKKIVRYKKLKNFKNDKAYRYYLTFFPNPLPHNSLKTKNPELCKEWDFKKNSPLKPENFSFSSAHTVWWICKFNHSWKASISNRNHATRPTGCPKCKKKPYHKDNFDV